MTLLAIANIVLCLTARPVLLAAEKHYLATDTIMAAPGDIGFTAIEIRLTQRLRREIRN